jgi:Cell Wall Hydrolase
MISVAGVAIAMQPVDLPFNAPVPPVPALAMDAITLPPVGVEAGTSNAANTLRPLSIEPDSDLGVTVYAAHFAKASAPERACLARALYYEARGEPYEGQVAVAQVILNRVRSKRWPDSICGVVNQGIERGEKCQFSFACHATATELTGESWDQAQALATEALAGRAWLRETMEATHYHTTSVAPVWRQNLTTIGTFGSHIFYRDPQATWTGASRYARSNGAIASVVAPKSLEALANAKAERPRQLVKSAPAVASPGPKSSTTSADSDWASRVFHP